MSLKIDSIEIPNGLYPTVGFAVDKRGFPLSNLYPDESGEFSGEVTEKGIIVAIEFYTRGSFFSKQDLISKIVFEGDSASIGGLRWTAN